MSTRNCKLSFMYCHTEFVQYKVAGARKKLQIHPRWICILIVWYLNLGHWDQVRFDLDSCPCYLLTHRTYLFVSTLAWIGRELSCSCPKVSPNAARFSFSPISDCINVHVSVALGASFIGNVSPKMIESQSYTIHRKIKGNCKVWT